MNTAKKIKFLNSVLVLQPHHLSHLGDYSRVSIVKNFRCFWVFLRNALNKRIKKFQNLLLQSVIQTGSISSANCVPSGCWHNRAKRWTEDLLSINFYLYMTMYSKHWLTLLITVAGCRCCRWRMRSRRMRRRRMRRSRRRRRSRHGGWLCRPCTLKYSILCSTVATFIGKWQCIKTAFQLLED